MVPRTSIIVVAVAVFGSMAAAQPAQPGTDADAWAAVRFMVGSWRHVEGDTVSEERWLEPSGTTMFGFNATTESDQTTAFEYLRVERRADGIVYVASPGGGPATEFRYAPNQSEAGQRAVFVNAEHDFPNRITYWREGGTLHAAIAGSDGETAASWSWERVPATTD